MTLGILDYNKLNMKIASIYGQSAVQWTMNAAVEPIFVGSTGIVSAFSLVSTAFPWSNSENPYFPASTIRARCVFLRHARVKHQNKRREITLIKQSLGNGSRFIEDRSVSQLLLYIIEETGQVDTDSSKQSGFQQQPS